MVVVKPGPITPGVCSVCSLETPGLVKRPLPSFLADSIEANVESSEVHVERATDQLQRAAYYQVKEGTRESPSVPQTLWAIRIY